MTSEVENYRVVLLYLLIVDEMFLESGQDILSRCLRIT
jgi:hypothetical protein